MNAPLRVMVVGCGLVATEYHLPAIAHSKRARLAAVVDLDAEWARQVGRRFGAPRCGVDWTSLVGEVDAAIVATPNSAHAEAVEAMLTAGIHVLCEKPLAVTAHDARRLYDLSAITGSRLMAAHSRRFSPHLAFLKQLVRDGYLGSRGELTASLGGPPGSWPARTDFRRQKAAAGGGVMLDAGVHLLDLATSLFDGAPEVVHYWEAFGDTPGLEQDAEVTLQFYDGLARLALSSSHAISGAVTYRSGDRWLSTTVNGPQAEVSVPESRLCRGTGSLQFQPTGEGPYEAQLEHFCECLIEDRPFRVTPEEVVGCLEVIEACYATREQGGEDGTDA